MESLANPLRARIEWCQVQRIGSCTREEHEGWVAEVAGLRDAFLGTDRTDLARMCFPAHVNRYQLGLRDGQAIMRSFVISSVVPEQDGGAELRPAHTYTYVSEQPSLTSPSAAGEESTELLRLLPDTPANSKDECSTNMAVPRDSETAGEVAGRLCH